MVALLQNHNGNDNIIRRFTFPEKKEIIAMIKNTNKNALIERFEVNRYISEQVQSGQFETLKNRLKELEVILKSRFEKTVDSVEFVIFLYYREGLSIRGIQTRINELGVDFSRNSLQNLMTNICGWPLRGKNEGSRLTELKYKKMPENFNKERTAKIIEGNKTIVDKLLLNKKPFNIEEYNSLKNYPQRIVYIFSLCQIATDFESAKKYVKKLNVGGFGMRSIAIIIKDLFINTIPNNSGLTIPKIDSSRVNKIFFTD